MLQLLTLILVIFGCFAIFGLLAWNIYRRMVKDTILTGLVSDIHEMKLILVEFKTDINGKVKIVELTAANNSLEINKLWACYQDVIEHLKLIEIGCAKEHGNQKKSTIISGNNHRVNVGNEGLTLNEQTETKFSD